MVKTKREPDRPPLDVSVLRRSKKIANKQDRKENSRAKNTEE